MLVEEAKHITATVENLVSKGNRSNLTEEEFILAESTVISLGIHETAVDGGNQYFYPINVHKHSTKHVENSLVYQYQMLGYTVTVNDTGDFSILIIQW